MNIIIKMQRKEKKHLINSLQREIYINALWDACKYLCANSNGTSYHYLNVLQLF